MFNINGLTKAFAGVDSCRNPRAIPTRLLSRADGVPCSLAEAAEEDPWSLGKALADGVPWNPVEELPWTSPIAAWISSKETARFISPNHWSVVSCHRSYSFLDFPGWHMISWYMSETPFFIGTRPQQKSWLVSGRGSMQSAASRRSSMEEGHRRGSMGRSSTESHGGQMRVTSWSVTFAENYCKNRTTGFEWYKMGQEMTFIGDTDWFAFQWRSMEPFFGDQVPSFTEWSSIGVLTTEPDCHLVKCHNDDWFPTASLQWSACFCCFDTSMAKKL